MYPETLWAILSDLIPFTGSVFGPVIQISTHLRWPRGHRLYPQLLKISLSESPLSTTPPESSARLKVLSTLTGAYSPEVTSTILVYDDLLWIVLYNAFRNSKIRNHIIISKVISSSKMQYNLRVWVWHATVSLSKLAVGSVSHISFITHTTLYSHSPHPVPNMLLLHASAQAVPSAWNAFPSGL